MHNQKWQISPDVLVQIIGCEAVMLDLAGSTYFGLDELGVRIWQLLQDDCDFATLLQRLQAEYEVDAARLTQDVSEFLNQLCEAKLLRVV